MALKRLLLFALHVGLAIGCAAHANAPAIAPVAPLASAAPAPAPLATTLQVSVQREDAYTLDDLRALATQHAWRELTAHLDDVRPASRDAGWQELAERAAVEASASYIRDAHALAAQELLESLASRFPSLAASAAVRRARAEVGLAALPECYRSRTASHCTERVLAAMQAGGTDAQSFEAAKLVARLHGTSPAMQLFARSLTGPNARARCDDDALMRAMFDALDGPSPLSEEAKRVQDTCRALRRH